jgi:hypothetical protein
MKPQDVYRLEQVIRASISNDLIRFQDNFKDKRDITEAVKIVEKKN